MKKNNTFFRHKINFLTTVGVQNLDENHLCKIE